MSEPMADLVPAPPVPPASTNGPPASDADARLSRIEAALVVLAAQQAAGPPPEGFSRPGAPPSPAANPLATLTAAVEVAQMTGHLPGGGNKRAWLKWPVVREAILVFRLYFDNRYSPTRAAQLGVPLILILLVAAGFFFNLNPTPVLTQLVEYPVVMVLAIFLFRILAVEVTRYAAVLEYLTKTGRG